MYIFDKQELVGILGDAQIGLWRVEMEEGRPPRFYADSMMDKLIGITEDVSPEERYQFHAAHISEQDAELFADYADKLYYTRSEATYRYNHPVKGEMYVRCGGARCPDKDGIITFSGMHQDISNLIRIEKDRAAEERLAEKNIALQQEQDYSESLFRHLIKLQTCGILSYKLPSHEIIVMNDMARRLYGFESDAEISAEMIKETTHTITYDNPQDAKEKIASLKEPGDQISFTISISQNDGSVVHVWTVIQLLEMENGDRIVISSLQDISTLTEVQEMNLHLGAQLDIIQTLANTYNSLYYIDMKDGSFVEIGARLSGVREIIGSEGRAQESLDAMCNYIVVPEQAQVMREFSDLSTVNERLRDKVWISRQFEGKLAGWSEGFFIAAKRDENGDCEHIIWATRSVDEEKRKEIAFQKELEKAIHEAKIANDAKSKFLFNMSHDIRTPMNVIVGFTDLLEKNIGNDELCRDYVAKIRNSSEILLSLINDVLEMARIESGKAALDETAWSPAQFIESLYQLFEQPMEQKSISFTKSVDIRHKYVMCDPVKLREIYLNILSNAFKYTPSGGSVSISLKELVSDRGGYALVETTISDSGIGMSEDYLPNLFDEFSRELNSTESRIEGTGLGMTIVKKLIDLMGGTISVNSKPGKGTTFVIRLYHRIAETVTAENGDDMYASVERFVGRRILLVEDNELNAEIAIAILNDAGFVVEHAADGVICIDMLRNAKPGYYDMILMDVQMPNLNGYETTKRIRTLPDDSAAIPIIALTANAFDEDRREALRAGMDAHLAKPIRAEELMKTIAVLLR